MTLDTNKPADSGTQQTMAPQYGQPATPISEAAKELVESIAAATRPDSSTEDEPDVPPATVDVTLAAILQWKRPHESAAETHFVAWLHQEIHRRGANFQVTAGGNVVVTILQKTPNKKKKVTPRIMFSCHTDTVHSECNGKQNIVYDSAMGHIFLDSKDPQAGSCLGADDGAGIWLCLEMIKAKVPGVYVFHRGEEKGGVGSRLMLQNERPWLENFDVAIAFDRKGQEDIVTHQGGQRCASDKFGKALAASLLAAESTFRYSLSTGGSFTDTKVYKDVIPECLNMSVGYEDQHTKNETLNYEHLALLRTALIKIDWLELLKSVDRDPKFVEPYKPHQGYGGSRYSYPPSTYKGPNVHQLGLDDVDDEEFRDPVRRNASTPPMPPAKAKPAAGGALVRLARGIQEPEIMDELRNMTVDELYEVCLETDAAVSVITALWSELEAMKAKAEMYRNMTLLD